MNDWIKAQMEDEAADPDDCIPSIPCECPPIERRENA